MNIPYLWEAGFILAIISSTFLAQILISKILKVFYNKIAKRTETLFDNELVPLLDRILTIGIWASAILLILTTFGFDIKALTATLGIGTILGTLVIKNSLINIIAGVTIMLDKPFKVGDYIELPSGEQGTVKQIGLRRTHLVIKKYNRNGRLIIPNSDLSKCKIINFTLEKGVTNENPDSKN